VEKYREMNRGFNGFDSEEVDPAVGVVERTFSLGSDSEERQ
jgi:hypothetical protein